MGVNHRSNLKLFRFENGKDNCLINQAVAGAVTDAVYLSDAGVLVGCTAGKSVLAWTGREAALGPLLQERGCKTAGKAGRDFGCCGRRRIDPLFRGGRDFGEMGCRASCQPGAGNRRRNVSAVRTGTVAAGAVKAEFSFRLVG